MPSRPLSGKQRQAKRRRRHEPESIGWDDVDKLAFPGRFTVEIDHQATGEGVTLGLGLYTVNDEAQLRREILEDFSAHLALGAYIRSGFEPSARFQAMLPGAALKQIARSVPGTLRLAVLLHFNYS